MCVTLIQSSHCFEWKCNIWLVLFSPGSTEADFGWGGKLNSHLMDSCVTNTRTKKKLIFLQVTINNDGDPFLRHSVEMCVLQQSVWTVSHFPNPIVQHIAKLWTSNHLRRCCCSSCSVLWSASRFLLWSTSRSLLSILSMHQHQHQHHGWDNSADTWKKPSGSTKQTYLTAYSKPASATDAPKLAFNATQYSAQKLILILLSRRG